MRQEHLQDTIERVEIDFEELRAELSGDLERFDNEIRDAIAALPGWLALQPRQLREELRFPEESGLGTGLLGPTAAAIVAGELESFVASWLGKGAEIARPDLDTSAQTLAAYHREVAALKRYIDGVEQTSLEVAQAARQTLSMWREDILDDLEDERVRDTEAIEGLVAEGALGQGRDARSEIAAIWEEQRARATNFSKVWTPVDALVDRALKMTLEGIDELRAMFRQIQDGMRRGFDALEDPEAQPEDDSGMELLYEGSVTAPMLSLDGEQDDAFDPYGELEDEPTSSTQPSLSPTLVRPPERSPMAAELSTPTAPMIDFFEDEDDSSSTFYISHAAGEERPVPGPPDTTQDYDVFQSVEDPSGLTLQLAEESEPVTSPALARAPEAATLSAWETIQIDDDEGDDLVISIAAEPSTEPVTPEPVAQVETETLVPDTALDMATEIGLSRAETLARQDLEDEDELDHDIAPSAPPTTPATPRAASRRPAPERPGRPEPSPTRRAPSERKLPDPAPCTRVRRALAPLPLDELLGFFGAPLLVLIGLLGWALANGPLSSTSWVLRGAVVLWVWLMVCPFLMRWKIAWKGARPVVLRKAQLRDETLLLLRPDGFEVGPWHVRGPCEIAESRDLETARWLLELTQGETTHVFVAAAQDPLDFDDSSLPKQATPAGAWEVSWEAWEALRDHARDLAS